MVCKAISTVCCHSFVYIALWLTHHSSTSSHHILGGLPFLLVDDVFLLVCDVSTENSDVPPPPNSGTLATLLYENSQTYLSVVIEEMQNGKKPSYDTPAEKRTKHKGRVILDDKLPRFCNNDEWTANSIVTGPWNYRKPVRYDCGPMGE